MAITKLVVSDLHLADGASILECFGERQQSAFEGLLQSQTGNVELIINGDCFDFLVTPPYDLNGMIDVATALQKLEKIVAAHRPFFAVLRSFIELPEHTITFITGNHDVELCFVPVQLRISNAITGTLSDPRVRFCTTRYYRPLPDVYIEHGNYYDFWNHMQQGVWDNVGQAVAPSPSSIVLPVGSRYFQHAAHPISLKYAYFDHFEPSMNTVRQIALLSLLDPQIIVATAHLTAQLLSYPRTVLANLAVGEERNPQRLFEETAMDFVAFQQDMVAHKTDWKPRTEDAQISPAAIMEFSTLREALSLPLREAVASICTPITYQMGESVARGMYKVLQDDSTLRYAIAGHTHMERTDPVNNGTQMYLNTASWTVRLSPPTPDDIMGEHGLALLDWLRTPAWQNIPLRDVTQLVFALIHAEENGPSHATLCKWEGD